MTTPRKQIVLDATTLAKLAITAFFLPLLSFLIIYGSTHNQGGMIGLGIAMVGVLGAFWGDPRKNKPAEAGEKDA